MPQFPLLEIGALVLMGALAVVQMREGLFRSFTLLANVILAGLLAFNLWEPLASLIGGALPSLDPYVDALVMTLLVGSLVIALRTLTLRLAPRRIHMPVLVDRLGGAAAGLLAGYVLAGILICMLQTLPWNQRFLGYDSQRPLSLGAPDRAWLAFVHRTSGTILDRSGDREQWFDADGSYLERYRRYRRLLESGEPARNRGEFQAELPASRPLSP